MEPAYRGFIETTLDALLIFEGCRRQQLTQITRRLSENEKRDLITSGAIFVFDEEDTGIKRWTDGLTWSPSRTLGNFLIYRELDKKANSAAAAASADGEGEEGSSTTPVSTRPVLIPPSARRKSVSDEASSGTLDKARERALVGSLTASYSFRTDGLVKKTISLSGLHMIGYYRIDDVTSGRLRTPSSHAELAAMEIHQDFLSASHFRAPPLVEVGADGRMRYKGEAADAPLSPVPRASSSLHGGNTPHGLSRVPSSDSIGPRVSPRLPTLQLNTAGPSSQREGPPNSPQRGSVSAIRTSNRFDPYSVQRQSPTLARPSSGSGAFPLPLPLHEGDSHRRASAGHVGLSSLSGVGDSFKMSDPSTGLSPALDSLSASPGDDHSWSTPMSHLHAHPSQHRSPSTAHPYHMPASISQHPASHQQHPQYQQQSQFYQPRHATPYSPNEPVASASGASSNAIFQYTPPPPHSGIASTQHQQMRRPEHGSDHLPSTAPGYSSYSAPLSAASLASSTYPGGPSSTSRPTFTSSHHPTSQQYYSFGAPISFSGEYDRPSSRDSTSGSGPTSHMAGPSGARPPSSYSSDISPSLEYASPGLSSRYHSYQPQRSQYLGFDSASSGVLHSVPPGSSGGPGRPAPALPPRSTGGPSPYAFTPTSMSEGGGGTTERKPSGMVMALASGLDEDVGGRHGLGLHSGATPAPPQSIYSKSPVSHDQDIAKYGRTPHEYGDARHVDDRRLGKPASSAQEPSSWGWSSNSHPR
ncbi:BQ2448_753 [Microbotryum intermedium]|uniref:BQ2448_753 protein n=1 Tax=Microbotryum intermedium TaxID=269621 RepID=A0A238F394_9BASI|nr:BQ2448_753 [Microbotryum intermedium]